ncbi:unnamed protein product [Cylicocyclus nassatus]|uniref:Uncharacterized protein n=1 Tax=Cylicocyclus nassatus TaxID=53992 RepID=A0AA36HGJ1_CYLNA|nr:unnamed protein product [Cylicocyclus nassatus]
MYITPKQYFLILTKIKKCNDVACAMKEFAKGTKSFGDILQTLEDKLLPEHPEAFLGACCIIEKPEQKQLLVQRALTLKLSL